MAAMDLSILMPLIIIVIVVFIGIAIFSKIGPFFHKKRTREIPRDSLQKLIGDLKVSGKFNKERSVKWLKFEGDRSVYRHRKYRIVGVVAAPECNVFLIKTRIIAISRVFLCPPELSSDINAREISIRARGVRRVNNIIWVPVLTERDIDMIKKIEQTWRDYYKKIMSEQVFVEFGEIKAHAIYEAAEGVDYRESQARSEKMPTQTVEGEKHQEESVA